MFSALVMSVVLSTAVVVCADAEPFKDPHSGLEVTLPPGFTAEVQQPTGKNEDAITMAKGESAACIVDLNRSRACLRMVGDAELAAAAHRWMDTSVALGAPRSIRFGPLAGVFMEGDSSIPGNDFHVQIAVLGSSGGRVFVACRSPSHDISTTQVEAMIRSIQLPR